MAIQHSLITDEHIYLHSSASWKFRFITFSGSFHEIIVSNNRVNKCFDVVDFFKKNNAMSYSKKIYKLVKSQNMLELPPIIKQVTKKYMITNNFFE